MKTLSTWLALAGLFFMSAGHSLAATCPPGSSNIEQNIAEFDRGSEAKGEPYVVKIVDHPERQLMFLIIKGKDGYRSLGAVFIGGCLDPRSVQPLPPEMVAKGIFGSSLAALFAEET